MVKHECNAEGGEAGEHPQKIIPLYSDAVESESLSCQKVERERQFVVGVEFCRLRADAAVAESARNVAIQLADFLLRDFAQLLSQSKTVKLLIAMSQLRKIAQPSKGVAAEHEQIVSCNLFVGLEERVVLASCGVPSVQVGLCR